MARSQYDKGRVIPDRVDNRRDQRYLQQNPWVRRDGGLIVNAGIAKDAYFSSRIPEKFRNILQTDVVGNAPIEQPDVSKLWDYGKISKGMFATSRITAPAYVDPRGDSYKTRQNERYGFQFHYNPTTVQMAYAFNADFDVTMFTSGKEAFNNFGAAATQSNVSFNLVLNRIHDMKYFSTTGYLENGVQRADWSGKFPTLPEQQDIYHKGTMYDIEYFLRTVMQVPLPAALRNRNAFDNRTADMGFLTGIPVELHLGDSLRYWVRVDSFSLNHVIFNERMVPLFTEVAVTASRIPDYAIDRDTSSTSTSSTTNQGSSGRGPTRDPLTSVGLYKTDALKLTPTPYKSTYQIGPK